MKKQNKIILISSILIIIVFLVVLKRSSYSEPLYVEYDRDGKLLENVDYSAKDLNVILIVFNTLRAKNVGVYGYKRDTTPNIDKFAKENVLFKQAYAPWTMTSPALVSILTGQYPHTTGIMRESSQIFPENLTSIAEILKQNGYKTFGIASNPNTGKEFNFDQGFDEFIDILPEGDWLGINSKHTEKETNKAIELITKYRDDKFFLYLHYLDPHGPYTPPQPYDLKYVEDSYFYKYNKFLPITNQGALDVVPEYAVPNYQNINKTNMIYVDYLISQYDGEVNFIDYNIKILLNKLKELNLDKNSLIILMSDHGSSLGEHDYWFGHGNFAYDASSHVLLTMSYPKLLPKNKITDEPINTINVIPTILDILNIPISKNMEGKSLLPLILNNKKIDEYVYGEGGRNQDYITTIRDKKWKFIKNGDYIKDEKTGELSYRYMVLPKITINESGLFGSEVTWPIYELYDIENDPLETTNLIDQEPEIADKLMTQLYKWLSRPQIITIKELQERRTDIQRSKDLDEETIKRLQALGYLI